MSNGDDPAWSGAARLTGNTTMTATAIERAAGQARGIGAGRLAVAALQRFAVSQTFAAHGLVDSWRISNFFDYDPASPTSAVMQLRRARLSMENYFGDD